MSIRITQGTMFSRAVADVQRGLQRTSLLQQQIASGRRVQRPSDDPVAMRPAIDDALRRDPRPYLTFSARTDEFLVRRSVAALRANVDHLLERAADELVFTTPDEALRALHLGTAPQEGG